jgi:hypothetical protein
MNARAILLSILLAVVPAAPVRAQSFPGDLPSATRQQVAPQWRPLPGPSLQNHVAAYDSRRHRIIAFEGWYEFPSDHAAEVPGNRAWALSLDGTPTWEEIVARGPAPTARIGHTAVYDPVRDRLLVFGGGNGATGDPPYLNEVWALSLSGEPVWTRLEISGVLPPPRAGHCAIYDPIHDAMIVFGSNGGAGYETALNDTWSLSLSGAPVWSRLQPAGAVPPPRPGDAHEAVFDPRRNRMVLIGRDLTAGLEAWALSLVGIPTWTKLAPSGASPREWWDHACAYDPDGDRVVIFGGYRWSVYRTAVWELSLGGEGSWRKLDPVGTPPSERVGEIVMHDPRRHRMILVGGAASPQQGTDTWALALRGRLEWSPLIESAPLPSGRSGHTAIYDSQGERMVIYGGDSYENYPYSAQDVWALSLAGDRRWVPLRPREWSPPDAGRSHSAIYDPIRERMLVFGGITDRPDSPDPSLKTRIVNDLRSFSLAGEPTWSKVDAGGDVPPPIMRHLAIYDPDGDRMVVFGGRDSLATRGDLWSLSLVGTPTWTRLTPTNAGPGPRELARGVYDPLSRRMIVAGGSDGHRFHDDVWALSLVGPLTWSRLAWPAPPGSLLCDAKGERLVSWDGSNCWTMSLRGQPVWTRVVSANEPPPVRAGQSSIYDPRGGQIVAFGGGFDMNDTWALSLDAKDERANMVRSLAGATLSASLGTPSPNPSARGTKVELVLAQPGRVSLGVFDAAGRRIRCIADGAFEPGAHSFEWDGRDAENRRVPTGLYFMRLETGGRAITRKTVIAR